MTATIIPAAVLRDLRRRRGLVEYTWRMCLRCKGPFRSAGVHNRCCDECAERRRNFKWEFV